MHRLLERTLAEFRARAVLQALLLTGLIPGLETLKAAEQAKVSPAKVGKPGTETELATITLTPEAEKRLAITRATVERGKLERHRTFAGELILAPSQGADGVATNASSVFVLPSLGPSELIRMAEAQIDADSQVDRAKIQREAAKAIFDRAEKLLTEKAGSVRAVEEARTQLALAETVARSAQTRREVLGPRVLDWAGQKKFWVRVPIYVGDLPRLKSSAEARIGGLSDLAGARTRPAKPVRAPAAGNFAGGTVDLFYEVTNEDDTWRLGQKVGVTIPMQEPEESLIVPWSAVVHDIYGGAWVYENTGPQTYTRRRVQVRGVVGQKAALASGPAPGARIVTAGAAELFGTEFGSGK